MVDIALLEDNIDDVYLIKRLLPDFKIDHYDTIQSFKENKNKYKAVILDLNLPDGLGLEAVKSVRAFFSGEIIVLTGMMFGNLTGRAIFNIIKMGANNVFQKSALTKESIGLLRDVLLNVK